MNQIKTTPKDFFFHLGATIALYASVGALIQLSFSIINYYFPDQLAGYFYGNTMAWPISMLIVLVPILYALEWIIKKDIKNIPEKSELWVRRWRIYLTLFLTGVVLAGDLISLIYTYLNGEITSRFVYKFLVILVVLGVVFVYYLLDRLNKKAALKTTLSYLGIVIVLASIVTGFITVGSPTKQRVLRFDSQRVSDLQNIQYQVVNFWQQKEGLPTKLESLNDSLYGSVIPKDPETDITYEYKTTGPLSFELCATFALETQDTKGRGEFGYGMGGGMMAYDTSVSYPYYPGGENENWKHAAGKVCFQRTIDPEKYPPYPKPL